jgi:hypothetical protein
LCAFAGQATAVQFTIPSDADLRQRSDLVAEVLVRSRQPASSDGDVASETAYRLELVEVFAGDASIPATTLELRVPGVVEEDGHGWRTDAAPVFVPGQQLIVFLYQHDNQVSWRLTDLGLSAFVLRPENSLFQRLLPAGRLIEGGGNHRFLAARNANGFRRWLRSAGEVSKAEDSYLVPMLAAPSGVGSKGLQQRRWQRFDERQDVLWRHTDRQQLAPSIDQSLVVKRALASWTNDSATAVRYRYGGTLSEAEINPAADRQWPALVLWDRPFSDGSTEEDYNCVDRGVLGWASWLPAEGADAQHTFEGEVFDTVDAVRVFVNRGAECYLNRPQESGVNAEELIAHEMGHSLGLPHSCERDSTGRSPACASLSTDHPRDQAIMRWNAHGDRGAALGEHDRDALLALYPDLDGVAARLFSYSPVGDGEGEVTLEGRESELNCSGPCDILGPIGESISLSATAGAGSDFLGWRGDCAAVYGSVVEVALGSDQACQAIFAERQSNTQLVTINRPACEFETAPSAWRNPVTSGESLVVSVNTTVPLDDLVVTGSCFSSRLGDSNQWDSGTVSFDCSMNFLVPLNLAPDCSDLFSDRFERP